MNETGIYLIKNIINGKGYVGKGFIDDRKRSHLSLLRRNRHYNNYLQNSWNKYGEKSFVFYVITKCKKEQMIEKEKFYIQYLKTNIRSLGYNLADPNFQEFSQDER